MGYRYSIIIPIYNAEKTIERCLDSLKEHARGIAEIIMVDDGSTDRSAEICKEYSEHHDNFKLICQKNAGASSARNIGLDAAEGEYIAFVDSDDYVPNNYFHILEQGGDADFSVFPFFRIQKEGIKAVELPESVLREKDSQQVIMSVIQNRFASPWNKRYKREIIEKHHCRFKQDLRIGEDFIFGLEYMLMCDSAKAVNHYLYFVDETVEESITRGTHYAPAAYIQIYRYAFKIAEKCKWSKQNQKQLFQLLDYLYCRTAFAVAEHLQVAKWPSGTDLEQVIEVFNNNLRFAIEPINGIHRLMKWSIQYKIKIVFELILFFHKT